MDIRTVLKNQYHAALAMLRQSIERCPEDCWISGDHPRNTWRIAYHALFFTHLYLGPDVEAFRRWEKHRDDAQDLGDDGDPKVAESYTKQEMLEYWRLCDAMIDDGVDRIDLDAEECGFPWYRLPKLDHQLMNIRHLQQHAGQISERLYAAGVDLDWIGPGP